MFILEARRRMSTVFNRTTHVLGVFSEVEKAKKWVVKNGKYFANTEHDFFAVCETEPDTGEMFFVKAYEKNGKETNKLYKDKKNAKRR